MNTETACSTCFAPECPAYEVLCELCEAADMWAAKDEKEAKND